MRLIQSIGIDNSLSSLLATIVAFEVGVLSMFYLIVVRSLLFHRVDGTSVEQCSEPIDINEAFMLFVHTLRNLTVFIAITNWLLKGTSHSGRPVGDTFR